MVTDTGPVPPRATPWVPLGGPRTSEEHLAQHQVGWSVVTHALPPKCRSRVGRGGSWNLRHLSHVGNGVREGPNLTDRPVQPIHAFLRARVMLCCVFAVSASCITRCIGVALAPSAEHT